MIGTTTVLTVWPGAKLSVPLRRGVVDAGGRRAVARRVVDGDGAVRTICPAGPPSSTGTSTEPSFSSTTASRTNSRGVGDDGALSTMLTSVLALAMVALPGVLSVNRNETRPSTSGQSRSWTRTTFVVSPGAKVSVPLGR